MSLLFDESDTVDADDQAIAAIVADLGSRALERSRLYERELESSQVLDRILRAAPRFHTDSREAAAEAICREGRLTFGADLAVLWRLGEDRMTLAALRSADGCDGSRPGGVPRGLPRACGGGSHAAHLVRPGPRGGGACRRARADPPARREVVAPGTVRGRRPGGDDAHDLVADGGRGAGSRPCSCSCAASSIRLATRSSRSSAGVRSARRNAERSTPAGCRR